MSKIKQFMYRHAAKLTVLALACSFSTGFGQHCRTWFYQPKVPKE